MTVWFTSDTHFGDPRVLRIDRRPYPGLAAHDEALVAAWRERVAADDEIWHLGDFCFAKPAERAAELLARLPGRKHLVIGNNDGPATISDPSWASVQHYAEMALDGHHLVLCHYPFRTWNHMGKGWIDLHGHSHGKLKPAPRQIDVGVDAFGFRPVTLGELLASRGIGRKRAGGAEA
jgi:calcineurin-like phosphoesterase family protein